MTFSSQYGDMLKDTVSVSLLTGRDGYNKPTYGTPVEYSVRIVRKNRLVRSSDGSVVTSSSHLWMDWVDSITEESRFEFADGSVPTPLSIEKFKDEEGTSHMKVFFQ